MRFRVFVGKVIAKVGRTLGLRSLVRDGYLREQCAEADRMGIPLMQLYEADTDHIVPYRQAIADSVISRLPQKSARVVEIGTGAGLTALRILGVRPDIEYISFEPEKYLVSHLGKWTRQYNFKSLPARGADLRGVENSSADAVVSQGVFTILAPIAIFRYVDEAVRVLKPGGAFSLNFFDTDKLDAKMIAFIRRKTAQGDSRPLLSGRFFRTYLESCGLSFAEQIDHPTNGYVSTWMLTKNQVVS